MYYKFYCSSWSFFEFLLTRTPRTPINVTCDILLLAIEEGWSSCLSKHMACLLIRILAGRNSMVPYCGCTVQYQYVVVTPRWVHTDENCIYAHGRIVTFVVEATYFSPDSASYREQRILKDFLDNLPVSAFQQFYGTDRRKVNTYYSTVCDRHWKHLVLFVMNERPT